MTKQEQVWITGVGTASPLGNDYAAASENLLAGRSFVRNITSFDAANHPCRIGGQLDPLPAPPGWEEREFTRLTRIDQLVLWCAVQALRDAGCWERRGDLRIGLVLGHGCEWLLTWALDRHLGGCRMVEPEQDTLSLAGRVSGYLDLSGPYMTVGTACASNHAALEMARSWLALGLVDVCLAGGCDHILLEPLPAAAFGNMGALSRRNHDPATASRPFDRDRDGFVIGEGGGLFLLEPADRARRRGAHGYAETAGFGSSSDAYHSVIPSSDPTAAVASVRAALAEARVNPDEIDYVNAHATSTPVGDVFETRVLKTVLGDHVTRVPVSATKSMTGHLISGSGAMGVLACLTSFERQAIHPTINLDELDPECDLLHVRGHAQDRRVRTAIANSFGFGGCNSCIVLRQVA